MFFLSAAARSPQTTVADTLRGFVEGRVLDVDGSPMQMATLRVTRAADSVFVAGGVSDSLGRYRVGGLPVGSYVMRYSMLGYRSGLVKFNVLESRPFVSVPDIHMQTTDHTIGEALVVGSAPPVTVVDDTVAYNANAYQVPEGSMVEDLIEQIPGAEVTDDGKIKINGKEYNKILVNGKEFFGNDPQAALKNLPANIVKRIKTYDRKSDRARITGIDDGEENNVIDLEIKPNMLKGLVGQIGGALGSHDRYSATANVNRFRQDGHVSLMGGLNNVNNPGFSERGRGSMNFSRAAQPGLTAAKSVGLSLGKDKKDHYRINGNLRYGYTNGEQRNSRHSETAYSATNYRYGNSESRSLRRRYEINANFFMEWKPDTLTTLQLRPDFNYSSTDNNSQSKSDASRWDGSEETDTIAINRQNSSSSGGSDNTSATINLNAFRRLNAKGRNISASGSFSYGDGKSENFSSHDITYFLQPDRNRDYNRYSDGANHRMGYSASLSYNEPLFKGAFMQLRYGFNYSHSRSNSYGRERNYTAADSTIDRNAPVDWQEIPVDTALSSCTENTYLTHNIHLSIRHVSQKLNLSYGMNLTPRHNEVNYVFGPKMDKGLVTQNLLNWSPSFNFRYRFTKRTTIDAHYNGQSNEPNIDDLQEVIDKTNPQNIRYGNPSLKPSFTHSVSADFNHFGERTHRSLVTNVSYSTVTNSTSNMTLYESSTGVRVSKLMNVDGHWGTSGNVDYNMPLDSLEHWNFSAGVNASYNENTNYNSTPLTPADLLGKGVTADFEKLRPSDIDLLQPLAIKNHTRSLRLNQRIGLNFRLKTFSARLGGSINYYKVENNIQTAARRETFDYRASFRLQFDLPYDFQISTSINFNSRHGYTASIQKNIAIWNMQLSRRLFARRQGLVTLQIYDLLHQRSNVSRDISNLTVSDTRSEVLSNYFMLGFQWRINTMGRRSDNGNRSGNRRQGNNRPY